MAHRTKEQTAAILKKVKEHIAKGATVANACKLENIHFSSYYFSKKKRKPYTKRPKQVEFMEIPLSKPCSTCQAYGDLIENCFILITKLRSNQ